MPSQPHPSKPFFNNYPAYFMAFKNDSPGWIRIAYVSMVGVIYWNINNFEVSMQLKKRPLPQQPLTSKSSPAGSLALLLTLEQQMHSLISFLLLHIGTIL